MIQINQNEKIKFLILVVLSDYKTKINELGGKFPNVSNSATKTTLTTVGNKIPDASNLVKKNRI